MDAGFKLLENEIVYDEAFVVRESSSGLFNSFTTVGVPKVCGLTREGVVHATRWYLKGEQEGWPDGSSRVVGDAFVGGKL